MSHWLLHQVPANPAAFIFVGIMFTLLGMSIGIMIGKDRQEKFDKWFYKLTPGAKRPWGI